MIRKGALLFAVLGVIVVAQFDYPIQLRDSLFATSKRVADVQQEAEIIEHHNHNRTFYFGRSATQVGNTWAKYDTLGSYRFVAGTGGAWGDTIKILGSSDTPPIGISCTHFDLHHMLISSVSSDSLYAIRLLFGTSSASQAFAAKQYTDILFKFDSGVGAAKISANAAMDFVMPRLPCGWKVWGQLKCPVNSATLLALFRIHTYPETKY